MILKLIFAAALTISLLFSCASYATAKTECLESQAAYDFGSGTTKLVIVEVDICKKEMGKILIEKRLPLALNEAVEKSSDQKIPLELIEAALPELKKWQKDLITHQVQRKFAVATAVYRRAKNAKEVLNIFEKELKISIDLISQDQEAELGYWSARSSGFAKQKNLIVWDIGGGSMQFYRNKGVSYKGDLASVNFKNQIIENIFFSSAKEKASPNPMGPQKANMATRLAQNHAVLNVPAAFKNQTEAVWVGIGGVLSLSVQSQVGEEPLTLQNLQRTLQERSLLTDSQIKGDYKSTEISNLALVLGYMKALQIPAVYTRPVSLGQGLIFRNLQP